MNAQPDQSVLDLLQRSAIGPALDRPVEDVLMQMGLPGLPDLSMLPSAPELPPLPALDLSLLAKPLTDLAATFGTGQLPATQPEVDPAQVFNQASSVVQTALTLGSSSLQAALALWQGIGATAAADKNAQAATDGAAISAQSAETSAQVTSASESVFRGGTAMSIIIGRYLTSLTAAAPLLVTPAGQTFVLALSAEALAEATAVVAETRGELAVHSAAMTQTGQKVPVTNAASGTDCTQLIAQVLGMVAPLTGTAASAAQAISETLHSREEEDEDAVDREEVTRSAPVGSIASGAPLGAGAIAAAPRHMGTFGGVPAVGALGSAGANPNVGDSAGRTSSAAVRTAASSPMTGPGFVPMSGAAGMAGRAAGEETADGLRGLLISSHHGDEVVGSIARVSLPVVGSAEHISEPSDAAPPDKALTL
ncbi:hypothetical protein [Nocardia sp. NPDC003963]